MDIIKRPEDLEQFWHKDKKAYVFDKSVKFEFDIQTDKSIKAREFIEARGRGVHRGQGVRIKPKFLHYE